MRISNIKQYLGGADNVIARDVIEGDQFLFNFKIGNTDLKDFAFEVDTQLFKANVTNQGSNITINSLEPVELLPNLNESGTITIAAGSVSTPTVLSSINISLSTVTVPTGYRLKVTKPDGTDVPITDAGFPTTDTYTLRILNGKLEILLRQTTTEVIYTITYKRIEEFRKFTYPNAVTKVGTTDPNDPNVILNSSANLLIPTTLLSDLTNEHASPNSSDPFIIAMSVTSIDTETTPIPTTATKRTFRLLWIVRYRPMAV